ncbi:hypothetical protein DV515_00007493 [Chloebia gouldiae]|uniref:Uncharacterized protein n=1 Tax=Chloebia gouldiae TaxID=44316 RepID=A0A3L8SHZ9_CHLGU|nr:hypothetical protein DV515_00007493 [Chloebia gouldiae]
MAMPAFPGSATCSRHRVTTAEVIYDKGFSVAKEEPPEQQQEIQALQIQPYIRKIIPWRDLTCLRWCFCAAGAALWV